MDNVVHLSPRPTEWDEAFAISVARGGQIFIDDKQPADGAFPEALVLSLSDLCKRLLEFRQLPYPKQE